MKIEKKHIIAIGIGVITIAGALAYLQYKKLMNYAIKFSKKIKIRSLKPDLISFDIFLLFTNNSDITFHIKEQEYKIYINDKYITRASNGSTNSILPKATNEIGVNVAFDPKIIGNVLKENYLSILANPGANTLRVDMNLKVTLWMFTISLPTSITMTFKELLEFGKK